MGLLDKAKALSNVAIEKGKDLTQITKLNIEITTLESKIGDLKKEIGNIVIRDAITIENVDINNVIDKINMTKKEIEEKKNQIVMIENKSN